MNEKRNTLQKRIVSEVFCSMNNHPSATMVYEAVVKEYPSISKATVYRILSQSAEEGTIQRLKLNGADDRFDITTGKHFHVVCRKCGHVADVDIDIDDRAVADKAHGFEDFFVEECHVEFVGICKKCQKEKN